LLSKRRTNKEGGGLRALTLLLYHTITFMDKADLRYLKLASGPILTEEIPDDWFEMHDSTRETWLEKHAFRPYEGWAPKDIFDVLEAHAQHLKREMGEPREEINNFLYLKIAATEYLNEALPEDWQKLSEEAWLDFVKAHRVWPYMELSSGTILDRIHHLADILHREVGPDIQGYKAMSARRERVMCYLDAPLPRDWNELDYHYKEQFILHNIRDEFGSLDWHWETVVQMITRHADLLENWGVTGAGCADGD